MKIELNANEVLVATYIGSRRNAEASFRGRKARFPEKVVGELWGFHIESASREDVKVRPDDKGIVVSVTGKCPNYEIKGWIKADDAKQEKWKFNKEPVCYFVPHKELNPIETLKKIM